MFPCVFSKLSDGSLENNTLLVASLDLALQGSLVLCLEVLTAVSWTTLQACFASWDPRPLGTSSCYCRGLENSLG